MLGISTPYGVNHGQHHDPEVEKRAEEIRETAQRIRKVFENKAALGNQNLASVESL